MKYIALTIGPIYKTLANAKTTRELWGGSYIFSYIMKEIIKAFKDREFIIPYVKDETIFDIGKGVGLFHDRFIFEAPNDTKESVESVVDEVLSQLAKDSKINYKFLKNYFQINIVEREPKEEVNPILELSPYLDTAELFYKVSQYEENHLQVFLKDRLNSRFLVKDAFNKSKKSFPSLPEIAMYDLKNKFNIASMIKGDELKVYEDKDIRKVIKPYHKYIAIVQADGDSMSKVVDSLKKSEDFNNFSEKLFNYCNNSHQLIQEYGGETIFAGGDDLLFFAPVVSGENTIFNLCDKISDMFDELFKDYHTTPKASLSFGVSITYYKFPLYEALESARELLFSKAKSGNKNNIAFRVTKHSGQSFEAVIHKGNREIYDNFIVFSSNIEKSDSVDNFLHSIHHKIDTYKTTINIIAKNKDTNQLKNFFDNYFDEAIHNQYREFFELLTDFIYAVFKDSSIKQDDKLNLIYATLRFVKFIKGDKE